jgi:outer membrane putative beta-barrel porin/alpha-amylase
MEMNGRALVCAVLWGLSASAYAQKEDDEIKSDRPGIADGSEVVGARRFQIETGLTREVRRAGEDPERKLFAPTLLRLGITDKWEGRLESDLYAWMREAGGARTQAYAPASIGFKYHFMESNGPRPSLGAIVRISPPSGSKTLQTRHTTGDVRLAADWELGEKWSLNPNVGFGIDEDDQGERFSTRLFAITVAYKPVRSVELFVDMGARKPEARGAGSAVIYDAGLAYLVSRDIQLDLSFGARGTGSTPPRSFIAGGISARF